MQPVANPGRPSSRRSGIGGTGKGGGRGGRRKDSRSCEEFALGNSNVSNVLLLRSAHSEAF